MTRFRIAMRATTLLGLAFALTFSQPGFAQNAWTCGNGSWTNLGCWSGGLPDPGDTALIQPQGSATVLGPAQATVDRLRVLGQTGEIVTLDLNAGALTATREFVLESATLAGSGRMASDRLEVDIRGRINVGAGEHMQLTGGQLTLERSSSLRILGNASAAATLEVGGGTVNGGDSQINLQYADVSFMGGLQNLGALNATFGSSNIAGPISNTTLGRIIVSNGAQVSFFDDIVNNGVLQVSAGGAANLFGFVSGAGSFLGGGEVRFEGGSVFSPGNSPAVVTIENPVSYNGGAVAMELGGTTDGPGLHDKIVFGGFVTISNATLDVDWMGSFRGAGGDVFDLFDWNGGLDGEFLLSLPGLDEGLLWNTSALYTTGELSIMAAIPEPGTYALLLAGLGLLGFGSRRAAKPSSASPASSRA